MSSDVLNDNTSSKGTVTEKTLNSRKRKYNVHGTIVRGKQTGLLEISYYECDNIVCKKIDITRK
ncbi:MAG: hypothetical protein Q8930_13545 [Bacillota bacterium]|nr:hypothetical protein [Bacillota bacterium]